MKDQTPATIFNEQVAASYDQKTAAWAAGREAMFSFTRLILAELPAQARILCVGVGTGTEMIALAQAFPQWQFTAVEPAPAMLAVCRQKAEENGVFARCTFHEGYVDSLPTSEPFDGATCLLVSHFFKVAHERSQFFREIADKLKPGGILISSDLVLGMTPPVYEELLEVWLRMLERSASSEEERAKIRPNIRAAYGRDVVALSVPEIEAIIVTGGFENPVLFCQTVLIHAWFSKKAASEERLSSHQSI